jgi:hypothetical protein
VCGFEWARMSKGFIFPLFMFAIESPNHNL